MNNQDAVLKIEGIVDLTCGLKPIFLSIFLIGLSCYFNQEDFEHKEKDCCKWEKSIVFYSNLSGGGDIYSILPNGFNIFSLTIDLKYKGKGTYTCGDTYYDINGNNHYDPMEEFTDTNGNLCWDQGEDFIDQNGNGRYDSSLAEPFYDGNNNLIYDCGEEFIDLNNNGHYDPQESFTDLNNNGCRDEGEPYIDENGNGKWDSSLAEPFLEYWKIIKNFSVEDMPSCNREGTTLLFLSDINGYDEIYSLNLTNRTMVKQLTSDRAGHSYPVFSPDGSKIAYIYTVYDSTPPYTGRNQIFIMNPDGSGKKQITRDDAGVTAPAWSSDGTKIAYIRDVLNEGSIWIINQEGTGEPYRIPDLYGAKGPLSWINNDTEILYWGYEFSKDCPRSYGCARIYRVSINGSSPPYPITSLSSDNFNPRVSSDGNMLVFVSNRDGHYEIYTSDLEGNVQRRITDTKGQYYVNSPAWCP